MEHKIGEIFEYNGEWYQCVKSDGTCNGCVGKFQPYSFCNGFKECVGKIFKKLEKVGEPYSCNYYGDNKLIMMQEYNLYNLDDVTNEDKIPMYITDYKHKRIAIEIKQTKADIKLKLFNLEEAKLGKPVCTRDRRETRIICFDREGAYPIVALVKDSVTEENAYLYDNDGKCASSLCKSSLDLMMISVEHYGWINIHKDPTNKIYWVTPIIFSTEQEAKQEDKTGCIIDTIRIQWRDD